MGDGRIDLGGWTEEGIVVSIFILLGYSWKFVDHGAMWEDFPRQALVLL